MKNINQAEMFDRRVYTKGLRKLEERVETPQIINKQEEVASTTLEEEVVTKEVEPKILQWLTSTLCVV